MKKTTGVSEEIYQILKNELINLELKPGQSMSENEISARFHASRTPTRDVFTRLEMDGLIVIKPHVGTFVSQINLHHVNDVLYMREKLELAVLEELAMVIDPMQKFKLSLLLMEQGNVLKKDLNEQQMAEAFHKSDNLFHKTLFKIIGKEQVFDNILNCFYDYERYRVFLNLTQKKDLEALYAEHLELTDNLCVGNLARMKEILREHLFNSVAKAVPRFKMHPNYFVGDLNIQMK